jgi:hypothetical protein
MIEIQITLGQDAFEDGQYIYVWLDGNRNPFYVGETSKSPIDRAGLHIRDSSRSGAIVSKIIQRKNLDRQKYTVLAFSVDESLLNSIAKENGASASSADHNRARKAIERRVYDELSPNYPGMHAARNSRWKATSGEGFAKMVAKACVDKSGGTA